MRVYLSGGISNVKDYLVNFEKAEQYLKSRGFDVINPAKLIGDNVCYTYVDYIVADLRLLEKCDYIYMLDDWQKSVGANLEYLVANKLGIKVLNSSEYDMLTNYDFFNEQRRQKL